MENKELYEIAVRTNFKSDKRRSVEFYCMCRDALKSNEFKLNGIVRYEAPISYAHEKWRMRDDLYAHWCDNTFHIQVV